MTSDWIPVSRIENLQSEAISCGFMTFFFYNVILTSCSCSTHLCVVCRFHLAPLTVTNVQTKSDLWVCSTSQLSLLAVLQYSPNSVPSSSLPHTNHLDHHHSHQGVNHITGHWGSCCNISSHHRTCSAPILGRDRHSSISTCKCRNM